MLSVDIKIQVEDIPRQAVMTKGNILRSGSALRETIEHVMPSASGTCRTLRANCAAHV